ncbi:hypothetical protein GCM10008956_13290 [Deinococcus arenae]|uniref:Uncharacterized protein n=1 Tax=Deinococcus arenae TaxID=1452751 RepID=A0A8H9L735_9DEIO|nr:hypothetical protein GCM10008956_13290 [Deinococcus arenae]
MVGVPPRADAPFDVNGNGRAGCGARLPDARVLRAAAVFILGTAPQGFRQRFMAPARYHGRRHARPPCP